MKRAERLYDAVTGIRGEFIEQAAGYRFRKRSALLRIGSLAAAACLAIGAGAAGIRALLKPGIPAAEEAPAQAVLAAGETAFAEADPVPAAGSFKSAKAAPSNGTADEAAPREVPADEAGPREFAAAGSADAGTLPEGALIEVKPQSRPGYGVSFRLPAGWTYGVSGVGEPVVRVRPEEAGSEEGITLYHTGRFGVCGTGLEQRETEFNGHPALQGFYDGNAEWSFIVLTDQPDCVILNSMGDRYAEHAEVVGRILSSVRFTRYGEGAAPGVKDAVPGEVSPAFVLDGVAEWARHRLGAEPVRMPGQDALFGAGRAEGLISDHEAVAFSDGTVFGYCTFAVPQWIVSTDGEDAAYGDGIDLVASLIGAEAARRGMESYVDGGINRAFFLIADRDRMNEYAGFYMNALSGAAPASVTAETRTVRARYTEDAGLFAGCLNADRMSRSAERHLPVYRLDTPEDLRAFRERFRSVLTVEPEPGGPPSFEELTARYDEAFFSRNTVVLAYVTADSGSPRFGVRNVSADGALCRMDVTQTNRPEARTDDMAAWFVIAEIPDAEIAHCAEFDARLVE